MDFPEVKAMRMPLRIPLALFAAATLLPVSGAVAQDANPAASQQVRYSTEQLDNLVASIALYPDPILAQVLVAATFPDQIELAVKYVRAHGTNGVDDQPWDVSVRSVAHYAPVLNMLAERPDWTAALGQAYAVQSSDVMESVQHLRQMAAAEGNLVTTPEQKVVTDRDNIRIEPANPRVIYVPTYDPAVIYYQPVFASIAYRRAYWTFGIGFPIGSWLMYDCDWYGRSIYYDDWSYGYGWRFYSRPFISLNYVYLQPRYRTVYVNRSVVYHTVNYNNLNRFNTVHRNTNWNDHRGDNRGYADRGRNDNRPGGDRPGGARPGSNSDGYNGRTTDNRNDGRNDGRNDNRNDGRNDGRNSNTQGRNDTHAQYPTNTPVRPGTTRGVYTPPPPVNRQPGRDVPSRDVPSRSTEPRRVGPSQAMPERASAPRESRPSVDRGSQSRPSAPAQTHSAPPSRSSSPPSRSSGGSSSGGGGKGSSSSHGSSHKGK
jgi:uncharacterized membrane protein YgcG